jgi:RND superfamily putative drug exporter
VTDPAIEDAARAQIARVARQPGVLGVQSYYETRAPQLISQDMRETYALVQLVADEEQPARVRALRALPQSELVDVKIGGVPAVNADVLEQVGRDLTLAEGVTLPIVAILLVVVFGTLVAAALPLAIGGVAILGAFLILRLLIVVTPVSVFAVNVVTMLGLGLAIDYSLFIVSRFREELALGKGVEDALTRTLQTAGHTVLFSGLTVTIAATGPGAARHTRAAHLGWAAFPARSLHHAGRTEHPSRARKPSGGRAHERPFRRQ